MLFNIKSFVIYFLMRYYRLSLSYSIRHRKGIDEYVRFTIDFNYQSRKSQFSSMKSIRQIYFKKESKILRVESWDNSSLTQSFANLSVPQEKSDLDSLINESSSEAARNEFASLPIDPVTLRFKDNELEWKYTSELGAMNIRMLSIFVFIVMVFVGFYGGLLFLNSSYQSAYAAMAVFLGLFIILFICFIILKFRTDFGIKHYSAFYAVAMLSPTILSLLWRLVLLNKAPPVFVIDIIYVFAFVVRSTHIQLACCSLMVTAAYAVVAFVMKSRFLHLMTVAPIFLVTGMVVLIRRKLELWERKSFFVKHRLIQQRLILERKNVRLKSLLHSLYPPLIIQEVYENPKKALSTYGCPHAVVLSVRFHAFSDVFREMNSKTRIDFFDGIYRTFYRSCTAHGLHRVRNSCGTFLAVGCLSDSSVDYVCHALLASINMRDTLNLCNQSISNKIKFTLGIHRGPVNAGAVNSEKGSFEIFGDGLNFADSLAESLVTDSIVVSNEIYEMTKENFNYASDSVLIQGKPVWILRKLVNRGASWRNLNQGLDDANLFKTERIEDLDMRKYCNIRSFLGANFGVEFRDQMFEEQYKSYSILIQYRSIFRIGICSLIAFAALFLLFETTELPFHIYGFNENTSYTLFIRFSVLLPLLLGMTVFTFFESKNMDRIYRLTSYNIYIVAVVLYGAWCMANAYSVAENLSHDAALYKEYAIFELYIWIIIFFMNGWTSSTGFYMFSLLWMAVINGQIILWEKQNIISFDAFLVNIVSYNILPLWNIAWGEAERNLSHRKAFVMSVREAEAIEMLHKQKAFIDAILGTVIPPYLFESIREEQINAREDFPNASLIVVEILDYKQMVRFLSARQMFVLISQIFHNLELLCKAYDVIPIKTIGVLFVGMSPKSDDARKSLLQICQLSRQIHKLVEIKKFEFWTEPIQVRVSISCGDVVGFVSGKDYLSYEIWGDAVNEAWDLVKETDSGRSQVTKHCANILAADHIIVAEMAAQPLSDTNAAPEIRYYVSDTSSVWGMFIEYVDWIEKDHLLE